MEKLKKFLMFSICLFSIFLINTKNVKAYGEEVSPMLDITDYTFKKVDKDNRFNLAMTHIQNNCQNYDSYVIYNNPVNARLFFQCFNKSDLKEDFIKTEIIIAVNSAFSNYNSVSQKNNQWSNYKENTTYYGGYYDTKNTTTPSTYTSSFNSSSSGVQHTGDKIISNNIIYINNIESNLPVKLYYSELKSINKQYASLKYNDIIYNRNDFIFDYNNLIPYIPTKFEYEISDGTKQGKKLSLFFNNYKESDYAIINNYQTGEEIKILDLKNNSTKIFDNISQDNTFIVVIYDENNEIILTRNIDIQENLRLSGERYILVGGLNIQELNSYFLAFYNTEKEDKCFYKFKDEEEQEIDCENESIVIKSPNKNTYVENYIKNKKGEIVVRKNVNLNYLKNLPQFKFESYYDDNENKQILEIIVENLQESDVISYSYDNEYFYTLETKRINYLDFYNSSDVYFKVERNSEIVSEAYFDVVYNSYVNSSNNNNLENTNFSLKNLLDSFKKYSENNKTLNIGTDVYNQLKNSKLGLYLIIIITGSFIILFVKAIKR